MSPQYAGVQKMLKLRGHFDGKGIVLDEPVPKNVEINAEVEVVLLPTREQILAEWRAFHEEWWKRPYNGPIEPRTWTREELHERR
jgi:hypothetical protein